MCELLHTSLVAGALNVGRSGGLPPPSPPAEKAVAVLKLKGESRLRLSPAKLEWDAPAVLALRRVLINHSARFSWP